MIYFNLICKSKHWPPRLKKVNVHIKKILKFEKDLYFDSKIEYNCNIVLTNNIQLKKMNYRFRQRNIITDVLTFVSEVKIQKNKRIKMCDIFLSAEIIKEDATKNHINFYNHLSHIIIHSFLHINGYVHDKLYDFKKMKNIEIKVLNKIGISNPYLIN